MRQRPTIILDVEVSRQRQSSAMDRFVLICQALATVCLVIGIPLLFLSAGVLVALVHWLLT